MIDFNRKKELLLRMSFIASIIDINATGVKDERAKEPENSCC